MFAIRLTTGRGARLVLVVGSLFVVAAGCRLRRGEERELPLPPGVVPEQVIDADDPTDSVTPLTPELLAEMGKMIQVGRQKRQQERDDARRALGIPVEPRKPYNILVCSGGGIYGAYSAGVLVGWSQSGLTPEEGGRPVFDVVTGISTGALIAPLAFLGPEFDNALREEYTTVTNDDIYVRRRSFRGLFSDSVVDNTPFRHRVERYITPANMARLGAEHDKKRRLYIGTTNIDTKRITLWDVGAIAKRGTPEAARLIVDVIVASASIPAFFPPVEIHVTIDGQPYRELHIDGGVTRSLFFRPPHLNADEREALDADTLLNSNLYVLVAGKIDPAPDAVRRRTFRLALEASSLLLYSLTRGDLYRMYTYCLLTGMNYRVAAIPENLKVPTKLTEFDPVEMTRMFCAGFNAGIHGDVRRQVTQETGTGETAVDAATRTGTAWRDTPPGLRSSEKQGARTGTRLTVRPLPGDPDTPTGASVP